MSKEDAIKSAIEILKNAGIDAKMVRIYGSTTEAIIVLPEMKFPQPTQTKHLPQNHSVPSAPDLAKLNNTARIKDFSLSGLFL